MEQEELAQLTQELRELEDTNARLLERAAAARKREAALAMERQNAAINDAIRGQRLLFANAHSMFTQFMVRPACIQSVSSAFPTGQSLNPSDARAFRSFDQCSACRSRARSRRSSSSGAIRWRATRRYKR